MNSISPNWFDVSAWWQPVPTGIVPSTDSPQGRDVKPIRRNAEGYLLLEVLLALVVLSIIVGLVFRIIQTTSTVTSNVQFLQGQQEHSDGIYELLRKDIESLPGTAQFQTKRTRDEFELIFDETPSIFRGKAPNPGSGL
jgi:type II secretory pathway pseudopilin PulG